MTTTITSLPTIPQRSASATFPARVDALLQAFEAEFQPDLNAWISEVNTYKTTIESHLSNTTSAASTSASTQASTKTNAQSAATAAGISVWVSGTTYAIDVLVYSPLNLRLYRRLTAGAGTTDPSLDFTNWRLSARELNLNLPSIQPSLRLNFFSGVLDSRVTFNRASSGTFVNKRGLIELAAVNTPRFDYDPLTMICKGLLIEESRTNLLTYSEQFDNGAWGKVRATVSANVAIAPDGMMTADKLVEDSSASTDHYIASPANFTSGQPYTFSVYAKAAERSQIELWFVAAAFGLVKSAIFDLSAKTVIGSSVASWRLDDVGGGWFRCSITDTATATVATNSLIRLAAGGTSYYTGNGTSGLYIWGAQLEAGSFATSYIPTAGSSVTRAADIASMTGTNFSSWYRQDEGTFVIQAGPYFDSSSSLFNRLLEIQDGTNNNGIRFYFRTSDDTYGYDIYVSSVFQSSLISSASLVTYGTSKLVVGSYKANDIAASFAGSAIQTDASASIPSVNQMTIGSGVGGGSSLNGCIARISFYPKRLTNAENVALSTY